MLVLPTRPTTLPSPAPQAGQYVKAVPVEDDGSIWQRIGLYVQGVPDCSLQEQVCVAGCLA